MPQGDKRKTLELFDSAYDGHWDGEYLRRGLGLLTDGRVGSDNLKTHHEQSKFMYLSLKKLGTSIDVTNTLRTASTL